MRWKQIAGIAFFTLMISLNLFANAVTEDINGIIHNKNHFKTLSNSNSEKFSDFDAVNKMYAFVVFYRSTCPHCQQFIPILAQFGKDFGFKIYAYSTDGKALPALQNTMPMTTSVEKTFFNTPSIEVPSLFIINTKTMQTYLIDRGEMDYGQLMNRVKIFFDEQIPGDNQNEMV